MKILSSPIYMGGVSGKLKVFIDRTRKWFHRPELIGKPVLFAATY
jgi:multimeric flavodoxin WrbA